MWCRTFLVLFIECLKLILPKDTLHTNIEKNSKIYYFKNITIIFSRTDWIQHTDKIDPTLTFYESESFYDTDSYRTFHNV